MAWCRVCEGTVEMVGIGETVPHASVTTAAVALLKCLDCEYIGRYVVPQDFSGERINEARDRSIAEALEGGMPPAAVAVLYGLSTRSLARIMRNIRAQGVVT